MTLTTSWVSNDLENVSSSVLLSSGLALCDNVALDGVVETMFRQGPNIDFRACTGSLALSLSQLGESRSTILNWAFINLIGATAILFVDGKRTDAKSVADLWKYPSNEPVDRFGDS